MENRYNIFNKYLLKLSTVLLLVTAGYGDSNEFLLKNGWDNINYSTAKNAMMSGATTATAKGYSALLTNPAGLATNYALGFYLTGSDVEHKSPTGLTSDSEDLVKTNEIKMADNSGFGLFYKYFNIEKKTDIHTAIGLAYGYESNYGLFSLGYTKVKDDTTATNYMDFGTGDYQIAGFQWQKSFINLDSFYALYFGYSQKGQGVKQIDGEKVVAVSPKVQKIGFGVETNVFSTTMLFTIDKSSQTWNHLADTLDTTALGIKWMIFDGFSTAIGISSGTYTTNLEQLKDQTTISFGIEVAVWKVNIAVAALQKEVKNDAGNIYNQENSLHADISFAF